MSERVHALKDKMIQRMNAHRRLVTASLPPGAVVMLKDVHRRFKFEPRNLGPYTIVRRTNNGAYLLRDQTGDILDRTVPLDQLWLLSKTPRAIDTRRDQGVYEVEDVVDHKGNEGDYSFLVKWKGYDEPTWVHQSKFIDTECIRKYWQGRQAKGQPEGPPAVELAEAKRPRRRNNLSALNEMCTDL
jgi:hypothetical protein